jgi:hypothetical protein
VSKKRICTAVAALAFAAGCGAGSSGGSPATPPVQPGGLSTGAHTLSFSVTVPSEVQIPVSGVMASFELPQGLTVATLGSSSGQILESALAAGSAVGAQHLVSGTFSPSTRIVKLSMATVPTGAWSGEFLRLAVTVEAGSMVTASDVEALGSRFQAYKAVGVDSTSHGTVVMTNQATTAVQVLAR